MCVWVLLSSAGSLAYLKVVGLQGSTLDNVEHTSGGSDSHQNSLLELGEIVSHTGSSCGEKKQGCKSVRSQKKTTKHENDGNDSE